jgi:predicted MFS family arabinose efflux permease
MLVVNAGAFLAMFFLTAVYLQDRLHLSALHAGLDFLPMGIAAIIAAILVSQLVTRVGTRPVQLVGAGLAAVGLVLLARSRPEGAYAVQLLPGLVLFGAGVISVGVPTQVAAVGQVGGDDAGIASGVVNTAWQIGGSLWAGHREHSLRQPRHAPGPGRRQSRVGTREWLPLRPCHRGGAGSVNRLAGVPCTAAATHR